MNFTIEPHELCIWNYSLSLELKVKISSSVHSIFKHKTAMHIEAFTFEKLSTQHIKSLKKK